MAFIIGIDDRRLKTYLPTVLVQLLCRCINAPECDGHTVGDRQTHIAVDAAALIPPALEILPVDVDRKDVFLIVIYIIADVQLKRVIGRKIVAHAAAVEIDRALARHTVKPQQNALALRSLRHLKMPAVPCIVIVQEAKRVVFAFVRRSGDHIVVRNAHKFPPLVGQKPDVGDELVRLIGIAIGRRPGLFSLGLALGVDRPFPCRPGRFDVAAVKPPTVGEQNFLSHSFPHILCKSQQFFKFPSTANSFNFFQNPHFSKK